MSSDVKTFFDSLSDSQKDLFMSVATDLQASAPNDKIKRLGDFHNQLKSEIDQINRRRQGLGGILNNLTSMLRYLNGYMEANGETLELVMFRGNLQKSVADLKAEVAALKPEKKLLKKFDVARRKESLEQRRDLAGRIFIDVLGDTKAVAGPGHKHSSDDVSEYNLDDEDE